MKARKGNPGLSSLVGSLSKYSKNPVDDKISTGTSLLNCHKKGKSKTLYTGSPGYGLNHAKFAEIKKLNRETKIKK